MPRPPALSATDVTDAGRLAVLADLLAAEILDPSDLPAAIGTLDLDLDDPRAGTAALVGQLADAADLLRFALDVGLGHVDVEDRPTGMTRQAAAATVVAATHRDARTLLDDAAAGVTGR